VADLRGKFALREFKGLWDQHDRLAGVAEDRLGAGLRAEKVFAVVFWKGIKLGCYFSSFILSLHDFRYYVLVPFIRLGCQLVLQHN